MTATDNRGAGRTIRAGFSAFNRFLRQRAPEPELDWVDPYPAGQRREPRVPLLSVHAEVTFPDAPGQPPPARVRVHDLSLGGARLFSTVACLPDTRLLLRLPLPTGAVLPAVRARVVWSAPRYGLVLVGLAFEGLTKREQQSLKAALAHAGAETESVTAAGALACDALLAQWPGRS